MKKLKYIFINTKKHIFDLISYDYPCLSFIQVGAHRGNNRDDVYCGVRDYKWEGLLIEPVGYNFDNLKKDYKRFKNIKFLKAAVGPTEKDVDFYYIKEDVAIDDKERDSQVGSLFEKKVLAYLEKRIKGKFDPADYIVHEKVPAKPLSALCSEYDLHPHLLYVDAEGYDHAVIRSYDFTEHLPLLVHYEHDKMTQEVSDTTRSLLKNHKYILIDGRFDTLAISQKYWERRGFEIMECLNKLWAKTEIIAEELITFEPIMQLVKQPGTYQTIRNNKGGCSVKRIQ